tara:strand:+ start:886 stop:1128 length:243 start_codon:yes stop_codon:yes gene_type:complete
MFIVYGKKNCPFCTKAVELLQGEGCTFSYLSMDEKKEELAEIAMTYNHKTVPIITRVLDGMPILIGGYEDLKELFNLPEG